MLNAAWYAVAVRSNFERIVAQSLRQKDYEIFSPAYQSKRQWSDRTKVVECALFGSPHTVAGCGLGAGAAVGADVGPVLCASREVEFSVCRLRAGAAGVAAICGAALQKLVSASNSKARKLEG